MITANSIQRNFTLNLSYFNFELLKYYDKINWIVKYIVCHFLNKSLHD